MDKLRIRNLLQKYLDNDISSIEEEELFEAIAHVKQKELKSLLGDDSLWYDISTRMSKESSQRIFNSIIENQAVLDEVSTKADVVEMYPNRKRKTFIAVAAIMATFIVGIFVFDYFFGNHSGLRNNTFVSLPKFGEHIPQGSYIQLENGTIIQSDSLSNGMIVEGLYKKDDVICLDPSQKITTSLVIHTTYGITQKVKLVDGSLVYLNAGSTIRVNPENGHVRKVDLVGEAFFEVVHNDLIPFHVAAAGKIVEDIGTAFDIEAYANQKSIKTTLLHGSVKIDRTVLKPGQQFYNDRISIVDTASVMAWKKGLFHFDKAELHDLLNQVATWYGIKIDYKRVLPVKYFDGEIQRSLPLSETISILSTMGINCSFDNNNLIVK